MDSKSYLTIHCHYIDCDGSSFGYVESSITIQKFPGVKRITDLEAFPSHSHPYAASLVEKLNSRGQQFEKLNGTNAVSYTGSYLERSHSKENTPENDT